MHIHTPFKNSWDFLPVFFFCIQTITNLRSFMCQDSLDFQGVKKKNQTDSEAINIKLADKKIALFCFDNWEKNKYQSQNWYQFFNEKIPLNSFGTV